MLYLSICKMDTNGNIEILKQEMLLNQLDDTITCKHLDAFTIDSNKIFIYTTLFSKNALSKMVYYDFLARYAKTVVSNEQINGIAITSGQDGETVQVKVPA